MFILMFAKIKHALYKLLFVINKKTNEAGVQIVAFGVFGILNYPVFYFVWAYLFRQGYESLSLRLVAAILCLFLATKNYWPKFLKPFLPIFWYSSLLYCLPFFGTFMFLKNQGLPSWLTNAMLVLFLLILLVDWLEFGILLISGIILGSLAYHLTAINEPALNVYGGTFVNYLFAIMIGIIFSHNKNAIEKQKIKDSKLMLIAYIAHELRTPLATINITADGIQEYLSDLLYTYKLAKQEKLPVPNFSSLQYQSLESAMIRIREETNYSNTIINMLLMNFNQSDLKNNNFIACSISHCLDEATFQRDFCSDRRLCYAGTQWIRILSAIKQKSI